jgi:class 3 adenylate cyclase
MFCAVVGSTELSTSFDPEGSRAVIGAYHRCVTAVLTRFGGLSRSSWARLLAHATTHKNPAVGAQIAGVTAELDASGDAKSWPRSTQDRAADIAASYAAR